MEMSTLADLVETGYLLMQIIARYKARLPDPETGTVREPSQRPALNISSQPPSAKRFRIKYRLADAPPPPATIQDVISK